MYLNLTKKELQKNCKYEERMGKRSCEHGFCMAGIYARVISGCPYQGKNYSSMSSPL